MAPGEHDLELEFMAQLVQASPTSGLDQYPEEVLEVTFIGEDQSLAELYRLKLELDGYWVTLAPSLAEGLEHLHDRTPDIAFLDLGVGDEAPFDVLGMVRQDPALRHLPVVLLLRDGVGAATVDDLHLSAGDFLVKVSAGAA